MEINKILDGTHLTIELIGKLETTTAGKLEPECNDLPSEIDKLTIDMKQLKYISSAGLRVILKFQKKMGKQGTMEIKGASQIIMEVFDLTGFSSILTFI